VSKDNPIAEATTAKLVGWLDIWAAYDSWSESMMSGTGVNNLPAACVCLSGVLKRDGNFTASLKKQRRTFKCLEVCALPTCTVETNLQTCVRCVFIFDFVFDFQNMLNYALVGVRLLPT
jgi:hypothetical protein